MAAVGADDTKAQWVTRVLGFGFPTAAVPGGGEQAEARFDASGFTKRLSKLMPAIKAAIAEPEGAGQSIRLGVSEAGVFARKQDFASAHARLDTVEDLLRPRQSAGQSETAGAPQTGRAIDDSAPGEPQQAKKPGAGEPGPEKAGLNLGELQQWLDDLHAQAAVLPPPGGADLLARIGTLRASLAAADLRSAADDVQALAREIALAARAARISEAQAQSGDKVTRRRLQRQWQRAQEQARAVLQGFVATLIADPDLQQDRRYPHLKAAGQALASLIPDDGGLLGSELAVLDEASDPDDIRDARDRATSALQDYSATLEQDENLRQMQEIADDAFDGAPFLSGLKDSLAALSTQLEKSA